jgi:hypothetical protein
MDALVWTQLYGRNCMDAIVWTQLYGRNCMDAIVWTQDFASIQLLFFSIFIDS